MKTAAVIIEAWKLPIFSRHLREAGYSYDTGAGVANGLITLKVPFEQVSYLRPVIQAAQNECDANRPHGGAK